MNAGASMADGFRTNWTSGLPDLMTVTSVQFKTSTTNFNLDPSTVTGDFYWNGVGQQPDYTMNSTSTNLTQYAGHVGGSTNSLGIGNLTFDPNGNGKDFLTWFVDVPSLGKNATDKIHFDLISELIISRTTVGNTQNLSIYLLGTGWDDRAHWDASTAAINLTISRNGSTYTWAASWAAPSFDPPSPVAEPASVFLMGLGLTLAIAIPLLKARKGQGAFRAV